MYQSLYTIILLSFSLIFEMSELYIIRMLFSIYRIDSLHSEIGTGDHMACFDFQVNAYLCKSML